MALFWTRGSLESVRKDGRQFDRTRFYRRLNPTSPRGLRSKKVRMEFYQRIARYLILMVVSITVSRISWIWFFERPMIRIVADNSQYGPERTARRNGAASVVTHARRLYFEGETTP